MDKPENNEPLNNKEAIGADKLNEIYKMMCVKVMNKLRNEPFEVSDETYRMIATVQGLYDQMNPSGNYMRAPYWGYFGGGCT